jgi:ribosome biogenesis SPOUT family RNA methylase Rps3
MILIASPPLVGARHVPVSQAEQSSGKTRHLFAQKKEECEKKRIVWQFLEFDYLQQTNRIVKKERELDEVEAEKVCSMNLNTPCD